jgi:putative SOS response-associated peptidase YedK
VCGRYASSRSPEDLVEEFEVEQSLVSDPLPADYNVAPTKEVYAVVSRPPSKEKRRPVQRQLRVLSWGLVPSWADDPAIGSRLINARVETAAEKPAFRKAFARRRCLLPADGYYEWYTPEAQTQGAPDVNGRRTKQRKQPFFVHDRQGAVLAMAGLYEIWRDPTRPDDDPGRFSWTCTVLTTDAEDDLGHIHERMPLLVEPERYAAWLDPTVPDPAALRRLLVPAAPGRLEARPVRTLVNNVRNNGPELVEPLPLDAVARAVSPG